MGVGTVIREPEDAVVLPRDPGVVTPVKPRVDDHLGSLVRALGTVTLRDDLAGAVGAGNTR